MLCSLMLMFYAFFTSMLTVALAAPPENFSTAKRIAHTLFSAHRDTLYCHCYYDSDNRTDLTSCGLEAYAELKRVHRMEWEHMMPAYQFGHTLLCWQEKLCVKKDGVPYRGRACCQKLNPQFRRMEAELYNLWPAVGEINRARYNFSFAYVPNHEPTYPRCTIRIDRHTKTIEPDNQSKGIVARATLFMAMRYSIPLPSSQRRLLESWNEQFPPNAWEKTWAKHVAQQEGYANPFIH